MVSSVTGTAVAGLQAAERRLQNSADNIANLGASLEAKHHTSQLTAQAVKAVTMQEGGVKTADVSAEPFATSATEGDDSENVPRSPVSLENEIVNQKIATYDYKANLHVLKAADTMTKNLLDIVS